MITFAKKVISCLIITSLVLMDVASCMDEQDQQKQALISTPLRVAPDSTNTSSSSDRDSPPRLIGLGSSSAPARLEGPPPSNVVVSLQQSRSSSFPVTRRSSSETPDAPSPFPSPNIGRDSSADLRLVSVLDPRQALLKEQREKQAQLRDRLLDVQPVDEDEAFNALLRHINFIMEGRSTEKQKKWGRRGAVLVGFLGAWPNSPVYETGLLNLVRFQGGTPTAWGISVAVTLTAALDGMPRNSEFLSKAAASSTAVVPMQKTDTHQRALSRVNKLICGGSILATAIPIKLFLATEIQRMRYVCNHSNNLAWDLFPFVAYLGFTLIPYLLDTVFFNAFPLLKRGKAYINDWYYQDQRSTHLLEEGPRNELLTICRETAHLLTFVSDSERRKFCDDFFSDLTGSEEEKAVKRLKKMIAFHQKHIKKFKSILDEDNLINEEKIKWATWTAKGVVGSVFSAQSILFYLILDDLFGLVLGNGALRMISKLFSALLGSLGGNAATSANSYVATRNYSLKLLGGKNPLEDDSHPLVRKGVTVSTVLVGTLRALPLTVLFTVLTNGWSLAPRFLTLTIVSASASLTNAWAFRWYNNLVSAATWGCRTLGSKLDFIKRTCHTLADDIFLDLNYDHLDKTHKMITEEPDREERASVLSSLPAPQSLVVSSVPSPESSEPQVKEQDAHEHKLDGDMKEPSTNTTNSNSSLLSPQPRSDEVEENEDDRESLRLAATKKSTPLSTSRVVGSLGVILAYFVMLGCLLYWQVVPRVDNFLMGSSTNSTGNSTSSFYYP